MPMLAVSAGPMQLAERALQRFDLALVINFLALGQFKRFQHFLHVAQRVFQFFDHAIHLLNGASDGRDMGNVPGLPLRFVAMRDGRRGRRRSARLLVLRSGRGRFLRGKIACCFGRSGCRFIGRHLDRLIRNIGLSHVRRNFRLFRRFFVLARPAAMGTAPPASARAAAALRRFGLRRLGSARVFFVWNHEIKLPGGSRIAKELFV